MSVNWDDEFQRRLQQMSGTTATNNGITAPRYADPAPQTPTQYPAPAPKSGNALDNTWGAGPNNPYQGTTPIGRSGDWFKGQTIAGLPNLSSDPEQINYQWTQSQGYGRGIEGLLNQYTDPFAFGLVSNEKFNTPEDYLRYVDGFNRMAISGSSGDTVLNPQSIVRRVLGSSGLSNTDPNDVSNTGMNVLGTMLYGGDNASNPSGQVVATLKFLQAALTGAMNPTVMNAYMKLLEEQGRAFLAWKNTASGAVTHMNFGQWVLDRLGGNGGL
jgi:hypothetical protein